MIVVILVFALLGCMGLFAALRPEAYSRYLFGRTPAQGLIRQFQGNLIHWLDNFGGMPYGRPRDSISKPLERCRPDCESPFLSGLRCGIRLVGGGLGLLASPHHFSNGLQHRGTGCLYAVFRASVRYLSLDVWFFVRIHPNDSGLAAMTRSRSPKPFASILKARSQDVALWEASERG